MLHHLISSLTNAPNTTVELYPSGIILTFTKYSFLSNSGLTISPAHMAVNQTLHSQITGVRCQRLMWRTIL